MESVSTAFQSQYSAALAMLERCITRCPDEKWSDPADGNRFWHIAYHTLFYTALYLSAENDPVLWEKCRHNHHEMTKSEWDTDFNPDGASMYTRDELLEFIIWLQKRLDSCFNDASMDLPSNFSWISLSRFELHIYNLRHLQHHTGQLSERIKMFTGSGTGWVGRKK